MNHVAISLRASGGVGCEGELQTLDLVEQDGEYAFTLWGDHEGQYIQIDFDDMTRGDLEDLRAQIDLILEASK